jgi:hypothetical protein
LEKILHDGSPHCNSDTYGSFKAASSSFYNMIIFHHSFAFNASLFVNLSTEDEGLMRDVAVTSFEKL